MFVPQRKIRQDGGCCKLVFLVPITSQILPPSVGRVGDVGGLVRSWEWRSAEDKRLGVMAAEHGMHGVLPLKKVPFVVKLVIAISNGVSHQGISEKLNEDLWSVKMHSFRFLKMRV